jgi:hypothetical protein
LAAAPRAPLAPRDTPDEVEEFQNHIDNAIAALQRLRQVDVSSPEVRRKALSALGATLRNFDLKGFKGQDPIAEAILQAVQSGLKSEEVRDRWSEVVRSLLAPAGENAKSRRQPAR